MSSNIDAVKECPTPVKVMPYLANDIARCPGVGGADGWREGCEDCLRRNAPRPDPAWWMTPPPIIVFECESRIAPDA